MILDIETINAIPFVDSFTLELIRTAQPFEGKVDTDRIEQMLIQHNANIARKVFETLPKPEQKSGYTVDRKDIQDIINIVGDWSEDVNEDIYGVPVGGRSELFDLIEQHLRQGSQHAVEAAPTPVSKPRIDLNHLFSDDDLSELVEVVDEWSRGVDPYDHGVPVNRRDDLVKELREKIRSLEARNAAQMESLNSALDTI